MNWIVDPCPPPLNAYIEALTPNVTELEVGLLGKNYG